MSHPPRIPPHFVPTLTEVVGASAPSNLAALSADTEPLMFPVLDTVLAAPAPLLKPAPELPPPLLADAWMDEAALSQAIERALPLCLAQVLQEQGPALLTDLGHALVSAMRQPLIDAVRAQWSRPDTTL